jgi:hypothetical protein
MRSDIKHLIPVHCVAPRHKLYEPKLVQSVPYIWQVDDFLIALYKFYGSSYKNQDELRNSATMLSVKIIKIS